LITLYAVTKFIFAKQAEILSIMHY